MGKSFKRRKNIERGGGLYTMINREPCNRCERKALQEGN